MQWEYSANCPSSLMLFTGMKARAIGLLSYLAISWLPDMIYSLRPCGLSLAAFAGDYG